MGCWSYTQIIINNSLLNYDGYFFILNNIGGKLSLFSLSVLMDIIGGANYVTIGNNYWSSFFCVDLVKEGNGPYILGRILWLAIWIVDFFWKIITNSKFLNLFPKSN